MPAITLLSVVLPAPFSPRRACTSPRASAKSTWSRARASSKLLVIPRASTTGPAASREGTEPSAASPSVGTAAGTGLRYAAHALDCEVDGVGLNPRELRSGRDCHGPLAA